MDLQVRQEGSQLWSNANAQVLVKGFTMYVQLMAFICDVKNVIMCNSMYVKWNKQLSKCIKMFVLFWFNIITIF